MSDSVRPHRRQPTRLPCPWDSPGKNTGVGRHFLLQCMKVKSESKVAQSCPSLRDPMDCSPPGSPIHEILQARVLEWGAIAFSTLKASAPLIFLGELTVKETWECAILYSLNIFILTGKYQLVLVMYQAVETNSGWLFFLSFFFTKRVLLKCKSCIK